MSEYLPIDERVKRLELARDELSRQLEELKAEGVTARLEDQDAYVVPTELVYRLEMNAQKAMEKAEQLEKESKRWRDGSIDEIVSLKERVEAIERRTMSEKFSKPWKSPIEEKGHAPRCAICGALTGSDSNIWVFPVTLQHLDSMGSERVQVSVVIQGSRIWNVGYGFCRACAFTAIDRVVMNETRDYEGK